MRHEIVSDWRDRGYRRAMPAPFARDLCGYRDHGKPNTSDASDAEGGSVALGRALFEALGVASDASGSNETGLPFAERVTADLMARLVNQGSTYEVVPERPLNAFQQYRHVGALADIEIEPSRDYMRAWAKLRTAVERNIAGPPRTTQRLAQLSDAVEDAVQAEVTKRRSAMYEVGSESLLKLDVTVTDPRGGRLPQLEVALSLKWTLRTDRAQDCRSQGAKLSALRRGRMPHFAALTMEPRPYMLNLLCGGSGDVDCVYHLHLPALTQAISSLYGPMNNKNSRRTIDTFERLVEQRRLRDYDELVAHIESL